MDVWAMKCERDGPIVDIHEWRGKRIVWAPHPAAHIKPEDWVDSVIEAVRFERHDLSGRKYIDVIPLPKDVERWARSSR